MKYINNNFFIEKVNSKRLAKKFGTPLYCYSYEKLKKNINNFILNFSKLSPLICFAIKSNSNVNIIREIKRIEPKLNNDVFKVFDLKYSINSKTSFGGTSFANIKKMIRSYKKDI